MTPEAASIKAITDYLRESGIEFEQVTASTFVVILPGERKQRTTVSLVVGQRSVSVNAFVARHPDENFEAVHRWLLERNRRMYAVAFCLDHHGDIYLTGHMAHSAVNPQELDTVLGSVLEYSDGSFNTILELGFATSIRREWQWRTERGLPTDNLSAFVHLAAQQPRTEGDTAD